MTAKQTEHLSGYQARDREVVDYSLYELEGTELWFRGPQPKSLPTGGFIACLGAAQTFGCFVEKPFPQMLAERFDMPVLNLGYGGAGARFYLRHPKLMEVVNRASIVVVQAMSGRSEDNSLFESGGLEFVTVKRTGERMAARDAWDGLISGRGRLGGLPMPGRLRRAIERRLAIPKTKSIVRETRANWIDTTSTLLDSVDAKTVFLWFSKRTPAYPETLAGVYSLFGAFPQLIDEPMVNAIRKHADEYVEVVSDRGSPQPLHSRFTGEPCSVRLSDDRPDFGDETWSENLYYPSPEMHVDAMSALEPVIARLLLAAC